MHIKLQADNIRVEEFYRNHSTYHEGDSGLDLFFIEELNIEAKSTKLVSLGIKYEAFIDKNKDTNISSFLCPRSSIYKTPLRMANSIGIIDAGYRGSIMVALDNISDKNYTIKVGQRLFQVCSPTLDPITFELTGRLSDTSRGEGGFGSTD